MMNDFNSNTRTLIVSFAIAIMFLIPLRFVEVGNMMIGSTQVLGETAYQEIVLPNAEVEAPLLEAPYDQTEALVLGASTEVSAAEESCYTLEQADRMVTEYAKLLEVVKGNQLQTEEIVKAVIEIGNKTCK